MLSAYRICKMFLRVPVLSYFFESARIHVIQIITTLLISEFASYGFLVLLRSSISQDLSSGDKFYG